MKYSQLHRFYLIDSYLYLNTEGISTNEMLERINASLSGEGLPTITLRQLQNDLHDMKDQLNAPIHSGRGQRKVKYDDISFCVFNRTREPYKITDAETILEGRLNWLRLQMDYMQESFFNEMLLEVMDYEDNMQLANIDGLPKILRAIIKERVITFKYAKKFSIETELKTVHPYFLHQYNNRWYLFALYRAKDNAYSESDKDGIRCYALDRISDIGDTNVKGIPYESMTVQELRTYKRKYFSYIVGVKNDGRGDITDLSLIFNFGTGNKEKDNDVNLFYNLLKSNSFYHGFKFEDSKKTGYASARIHPNPELENHLMMYAHAGYITNDAIREGVVERARQILATQRALPKGK